MAKTVITEERSFELGNGLRITLKKPADREEGHNNLIYVDIEEYSQFLDEYKRIARTSCIVGSSPIDLLPERVRQEDGSWITKDSYPDKLRFGEGRREIESQIADVLGARVVLDKPMSGTVTDEGPEQEEATEATAEAGK